VSEATSSRITSCRQLAGALLQAARAVAGRSLGEEQIFELEQALADQAAARQRPRWPVDTYALLIGISKYEKPDLSLQFAERDASVSPIS